MIAMAKKRGDGGKEKKFREENALTSQAFLRNQEITVEAYAKQHDAKVVSFIRISV